jgi:hypothetical protein
VTFVASDGELADSEVVEITVNNVNRPPQIIPIADTPRCLPTCRLMTTAMVLRISRSIRTLLKRECTSSS